jgi:feruloyl esterase
MSSAHTQIGDWLGPLCPFPQIGKYKGRGSTDDAASFNCALPYHEIWRERFVPDEPE